MPLEPVATDATIVLSACPLRHSTVALPMGLPSTPCITPLRVTSCAQRGEGEEDDEG